MKCPLCKSVNLEHIEIEFGLKTYHCNECGGNWIRFSEYVDWSKENQIDEISSSDTNDAYTPVYDTKKVTLCPDCGIILIKYKVAADLEFSVDHCGSCNGVWLDQNEWENLIKHNLHHQINKFFTSPWQKKLREEMSKQRFEEHYGKKFGIEEYEKLKGIREWIRNSPFKNEFLAYLLDENPYKI